MKWRSWAEFTRYAAATITFLNRADGTEIATCYPVTKVVLQERDEPKSERVFLVNDNGQWFEEVMQNEGHVSRHGPDVNGAPSEPPTNERGMTA